MKRSEINEIISQAIILLNNNRFFLPEWAYWRPDDWKGRYQDCHEIADNGLGWDVTDFGCENFQQKGLLLFTLRNGNLKKDGKTYCEKIMVAAENQETPMHFHWDKMEDIINRGGGNLVIELHNATAEEEIENSPVTVKVDGIKRTIEAGGKVVLKPGQSICLEPYVYHRFYGQPGLGNVIIGEVSGVNDDANDNRFLEEFPRFPAIEEDAMPLHLLVSDYAKYM